MFIRPWYITVGACVGGLVFRFITSVCTAQANNREPRPRHLMYLFEPARSAGALHALGTVPILPTLGHQKSSSSLPKPSTELGEGATWLASPSGLSSIFSMPLATCEGSANSGMRCPVNREWHSSLEAGRSSFLRRVGSPRRESLARWAPERRRRWRSRSSPGRPCSTPRRWRQRPRRTARQ